MSTASPLALALAFTLPHEGGFVDNPDDHGGATNHGVTQQTYDDYRASKDETPQSVRLISSAEVSDIYSQMYWLPAHCNEMDAQLAVCHFDWSVNHGVSGAIRTLQECLDIPTDGVFGPLTRLALKHACSDVSAVVKDYLDARRAWYRAFVARDQSQHEFLAGWLRRVDDLESYIASLPAGVLPCKPLC